MLNSYAFTKVSFTVKGVVKKDNWGAVLVAEFQQQNTVLQQPEIVEFDIEVTKTNRIEGKPIDLGLSGNEIEITLKQYSVKTFKIK